MNLPQNFKSRTYNMLINGEWLSSQSGETVNRMSPSLDQEVAVYQIADKYEVDLAVEAARKALPLWSATKGEHRSKLLLKVAYLINNRTEELALTEVLESGKPISQARGEIAGAAGLWEYAAALCRTLTGEAYNTLGTDMLGLILREPIGVVAMITPWNFPFLIISQKLPFALAAGCTAIIKPSEFTSGTTLILGEILQEAGLPGGVANILTGYGEPVGSCMAEHPDIDMISFTGSTAVGKRIVEASAGNLKKVSLELGGKNPQIVFADADLEAAVDAAVFGVYFNMGECCNSGSRLLVQESIAKEFTARVIEKAKSVKVGDPLNKETKVGAIINRTQYDKILAYIANGKEQGAILELGGERLTSTKGNYIQPTIFSGVTSEMVIAQEEIFGPVLSVCTFSTAAEALDMANNTLYGLSAGIWTKDIDTALTMARGIHAGTIWVNTFMEGFPELPFGGYRQSGQGRELGKFGIEEFTELKSVQVHLGQRTGWWTI